MTNNSADNLGLIETDPAQILGAMPAKEYTYAKADESLRLMHTHSWIAHGQCSELQ